LTNEFERKSQQRYLWTKLNNFYYQ
jgi:hypothetical protein